MQYSAVPSSEYELLEKLSPLIPKEMEHMVAPSMIAVDKELLLNRVFYIMDIIRDHKYGQDYFRIWLSNDGKSYLLGKGGKALGIHIGVNRIQGKIDIGKKITIKMGRASKNICFIGVIS
jgi:hypothetical protein